MAEEFGFRVIDGRRPVDWIQAELRRQIAPFLSTAEEAETVPPPGVR